MKTFGRVVLVTCAIAGIYLYQSDDVNHYTDKILGRQQFSTMTQEQLDYHCDYIKSITPKHDRPNLNCQFAMKKGNFYYGDSWIWPGDEKYPQSNAFTNRQIVPAFVDFGIDSQSKTYVFERMQQTMLFNYSQNKTAQFNPTRAVSVSQFWIGRPFPYAYEFVKWDNVKAEFAKHNMSLIQQVDNRNAAILLDGELQGTQKLAAFKSIKMDQCIEDKTYKGHSIFHVAAMVGCIECIFDGVNNYNLDINQQDCRGLTFGHYILQSSNPWNIIPLIEKGFDPKLLEKSRYNFQELEGGTGDAFELYRHIRFADLRGYTSFHPEFSKVSEINKHAKDINKEAFVIENGMRDYLFSLGLVPNDVKNSAIMCKTYANEKYPCKRALRTYEYLCFQYKFHCDKMEEMFSFVNSKENCDKQCWEQIRFLYEVYSHGYKSKTDKGDCSFYRPNHSWPSSKGVTLCDKIDRYNEEIYRNKLVAVPPAIIKLNNRYPEWKFFFDSIQNRRM